MIQKNIEAVCEGRCTFGKLAVIAAIPQPGRFTCAADEKLYDRIFYVAKGTFVIREPGKQEIRATGGTAVYLPSGVAYESIWENARESRYIAYHFAAADLNGRPLPLFDGLYLIHDDSTGSMYRLMSEALEVYVRKEKYSEMILSALFSRLLYLVLRGAEKSSLKKDGNTSEIYRAIMYLNDNYMSEITTEELAVMCLMSPASFRRVFKKYNNCSPMQYKMKLKMAHAREMLESGIYTVFEVSELMKCTDMSHFNRLYKAEFGINPSDSLPKALD